SPDRGTGNDSNGLARRERSIERTAVRDRQRQGRGVPPDPDEHRASVSVTGRAGRVADRVRRREHGFANGERSRTVKVTEEPRRMAEVAYTGDRFLAEETSFVGIDRGLETGLGWQRALVEVRSHPRDPSADAPDL